MGAFDSDLARSCKRRRRPLPNPNGKRNRCICVLMPSITMCILTFFFSEKELLPSENSTLFAANEMKHSESIITTSGSTTTPVFYNCFLEDMENYDRVKKLVGEQISMLLPRHDPVYITSIGAKVNESFFEASHSNDIASARFIPSMEITHHPTGGESLTLHKLWTYCLQNPSSKVIYMHAKGSFHPMKQNDILRNYLTTGALSEECLNLPDTCNICATRMSPLPHPHASGNMWLGRCSYIRKLADPLQFESKMKKVYPNWKGKESIVGLGRYALEHWAYSHPTNKPCDLDPDPSFVWGYRGLPENGTFTMDLMPAPRFSEPEFNRQPKYSTGVSLSERLVEYSRLYSEEPPNDWWGWGFYPLD